MSDNDHTTDAILLLLPEDGSEVAFTQLYFEAGGSMVDALHQLQHEKRITCVTREGRTYVSRNNIARLKV
jgi:hypothetical protein